MKDHKRRAEVIRIIFGSESFKHFNHYTRTYVDGEYVIHAPQRVLSRIKDGASIALFPLKSNTLEVIELLQEALPIFGVLASEYKLSVTILGNIYNVPSDMNRINELLADNYYATDNIREIPLHLSIAQSAYENKIAPFHPDLPGPKSNKPQLLNPQETLESVALRLNQSAARLIPETISTQDVILGFEHIVTQCFKSDWQGEEFKSVETQIDFNAINPSVLKYSLNLLYQFMNNFNLKDYIVSGDMQAFNEFNRVNFNDLYHSVNSVDNLLAGNYLRISIRLKSAFYNSIIYPMQSLYFPPEKHNINDYLSALSSMNHRLIPRQLSNVSDNDSLRFIGSYYYDSDEEEPKNDNHMFGLEGTIGLNGHISLDAHNASHDIGTTLCKDWYFKTRKHAQARDAALADAERIKAANDLKLSQAKDAFFANRKAAASQAAEINSNEPAAKRVAADTMTQKAIDNAIRACAKKAPAGIALVKSIFTSADETKKDLFIEQYNNLSAEIKSWIEEKIPSAHDHIIAKQSTRGLSC